MRFARWFMFTCLSAVLVACSVLPLGKAPDTAKSREAAAHLSAADAALRSTQISDITYNLTLSLDDRAPNFAGQVIIDFTLVHVRQPVTIDFNGGTVHGVDANGEAAQWHYNGWFITLAPAHLVRGQNRVVVDFARAYSTDGNGLHRFVDGTTGNAYLYTDFQPFDANKLFPLFDQPDLKARFRLRVTAPASWQVISATRETKILDHGATRTWHFPASPAISSYIFPLHAGPFQVWHDSYGEGDAHIALRLFARPEVAEFVEVDNWFRWTKQGFAFFNEYFAHPYPYGKYDQIIVPDFNAGGMENLAAVTFTEFYVKRGTTTYAERARVAYVIAHELAHMWFGNLVTMRWWDGLWLNESFATYLGYLQLATTGEFSDAWLSFYERAKLSAYEDDRRITTHAVDVPVLTTADAFTHFDGITYGKGAAVLNQWVQLLGPKSFQQGVAHYISRHAGGNTELEDFTAALAQAANMDLAPLAQQWLKTAGLNSLQVQFQCNKGQLETLRLAQSAPPAHPLLRSQKVQLGLYRVGQTAELMTAIAVIYNGALTEVAVPERTPCPDLVFPNLDDWGYVQVVLDETSRNTFLQKPQAFTDTMLRTMLWQSLWDATLAGDMSLVAYGEFISDALAPEPSTKLATALAKNLVDSVHQLWLIDGPATAHAATRASIEGALWQATLAATPGSDRQKNMFDQWLRIAHTREAHAYARALLEGSLALAQLQLDPDRRWSLIVQLNRFAASDGEALIVQELERDASERAQKNALAARAARPDLTLKQQWLADIQNPNTPYKLAELVAIMRRFLPPEQASLRAQLAAAILEPLPAIAHSHDLTFKRRYGRYLLPAYCREPSVALLVNSARTLGDADPVLYKALIEMAEEDARCVLQAKALGAARAPNTGAGVLN